jgi:phospholipase/carboxylesterase
MTTQFKGYNIHFETGSADAGTPPLLLLHGTGGDEHDLIPFGRIMSASAPLLGVRGTQLEGTITRWFRRHGEGVFDRADLAARADDLAELIRDATAQFGFVRKPIAIGYSNGANITAGLLMRGHDVLGGAVLMRAMAGLAPKPNLSHAGMPVLFLNGAHDPLAPFDKQAALAETLRASGAEVKQVVSAPGHGLTQNDALAARDWLKALTPAPAFSLGV